jgi:hypothetical protein
MLVETSVPGSDDWYLVRLCDQLGEGLPRMHRLQSYRDGDALLPLDLVAGERESYVRFMRRSRLHVVETLRDARTNRQKVIGFRTAAAGDEAGDAEAWKNWNRSRMKVQSRELWNDTADFGSAYILTVPDDGGSPIWQVRNGWDTISIQDRNRPWLTEAGITVGFDPVAELEIVVLYRPGYYRVAYKRTRIPTLPKNGTGWYGTRDWAWASEPIITPWTRDCLLTKNSTVDGLGIYEKHLDTVDRINEITLNALALIVQQAFSQRAIEGSLPEFYPEGHPQAGQKIDYNELFKSGPAALWLLGDAKIKELAPVDVRPVYGARKDEVDVLAALTSTPSYVFNAGADNQSAEGADLAREQLVFAVEAMNELASTTLAQAQALQFQALGDTVRSDASEIEVMWAKVNPASLTQRAEAGSKLNGVATQRWIDEEVLEMSPAARRQAEQDRVTEAFTSALAGGTDANNAGSNPATR